MQCRHCNTDSKLVCATCGAVVDDAELQADILSELVEVRPLSLEYYLRKEKDDMIDHAIFDKVLPFVRSSSGVVLFHFISHLKGASNVAWEKGFTIPELMAQTGIKSTGTMSEALAELSTGRRASRTRPEMKGWNIVKQANRGRKDKYVDGTRWVLNLDKVLEGEPYPLFHVGKQGRYIRMHHKIIRELLPTLTPNQAIIFLFIYRLTLGRSKEWDTITINYFTGDRREIEGEPAKEPKERSALTSPRGVRSVIRQLVDKKLIEVKPAPDHRYGSLYRLNPDTFLILETRAHCTSDSREVASDSREVASDSREVASDSRTVASDSRKMPPPNTTLNEQPRNLNSLNEKDETPLLDPSAKTVPLTIDSVPLYETKEGDNDTLSEGGFPQKRSREDRDKILRNVLGMEISFSIKAVHREMDAGNTTDEELDMAILHKQTDDPAKPRFGPGIYANYLTKKLDPKTNEPYKLIWKSTVAKPNEPDPAPKSSPPSTNGHGAAPHPSPTYNGDAPPTYYENPPEMPDGGEILYGAPPPRTPPPFVVKNGITREHDDVWREVKSMCRSELTRAGYNTSIHLTRLERVEDGTILVISAFAPAVQWIEARMTGGMTRRLTSAAGHDLWSFKYEVREKDKVLSYGD